MKFLIDESRIVGSAEDTLSSEVAVKIGLAIGTYFGKNSVIATGRDFRSDSHMIKRAISSGLMATGIEILDLHAAPTSTVQFIVRRFGCDGGISYTGAHYLDGEISVRLMSSTGNELEKTELEKIARIAETSDFIRIKTNQGLGGIESIENGMQVYKNALLSFINKSIISRGFRCVLDLSLGPISAIVPTLLTDLNIELTTMNGHRTSAVNQVGALLPEPESIILVSKTVQSVDADLGIIIDVEGTKVLLIDENGEIIQPEELSAFLIYNTLIKRSGTVILSELFTKKYDAALLSIKGTKIIRVPDTPGNIGRSLDSERAIIGTTDNGKLYNPLWGAESDATLTALSTLTFLAQTKLSMSTLLEQFRSKVADENKSNHQLSMKDTSIDLPNMSQIDFFRKLRHTRNYRVRDTLIGIKIQFAEGNAHFFTDVKASSKVQLSLETIDQKLIEPLLKKCMDLASNCMKN